MEAAPVKELVGPGGVSGPEATVRACVDRLRPLADGSRHNPGSPADALRFARDVEELSRLVEQLQVVAAASVEEAWDREPDRASGHRNAADCLRGALRIGVSEARRRLALAASVLPSRSLTGQELPPEHPEVAGALADGVLASRTATGIGIALASVHGVAGAEARRAMEESLVSAARIHDPDFVRILTRRWVEGLDQDGDEPSEEELSRRQGAFIRKQVRGLHRLEIFATTAQFEQLLTVMNVQGNPRVREAGAAGPGPDGDDGGEALTTGDSYGESASTEAAGARPVCAGAAVTRVGSPWNAAAESAADEAAVADRRSRAQKLLDGLVGACGIALASGTLPQNGGLRPQVMVTIPYDQLFRDLTDLKDFGESRHLTDPGDVRDAGRVRTTAGAPDDGTGVPRTGTLMFTGPVNARTIRKIACDADLIPVVLGGEGQVLDIGRASRVFPPHVRKALVARDQGCAFPGCTLPAPWCEAHHVDYWSRGGSTGAGNGVLLCSHHHHLMHQEEWELRMCSGIPWFIPPPHLDPGRRPRRNHYFVQQSRAA
ncbi:MULTISPECIES: HNH endonuclease signature motif containing protein [Arthrobacter]|uniref:DUF222 domain-containing protein n=2 Tax=Arthrobacter TaxID=1663 RepID=A0ABU9KFW3_9MICC|nr:HNH endonuclease signature motif containing protein [Arthrobacter sp. YJM1]MDP5225771.1 DUF222 domain-containing protein [Arthrobacter sp. YJM1]